jgi:hypothetical protein
MQGALPEADIVVEARRLIGAARERGVPLWLLGGLAVQLGGQPPPEPLRREYKDIDVLTLRGERKAVTALMEEVGYRPDAEFNTLNGHSRLLFHDPVNSRQVDVFVGVFELCHAVPIAARLAPDRPTVPLAELLLTKLQIVQFNEKDRRDVLALVAANEVADHDDSAINAGVLARVCAADWGLWRTARQNVERTREAVGEYGLDPAAVEAIRGRLDALWARVDAEPKTRKWKLRARVGDRVRWYEEPDEVE